MVTIIDPHIKREGGYHIHEASVNVAFLLPNWNPPVWSLIPARGKRAGKVLAYAGGHVTSGSVETSLVRARVFFPAFFLSPQSETSCGDLRV